MKLNPNKKQKEVKVCSVEGDGSSLAVSVSDEM